jgi:hypothetical protein
MESGGSTFEIVHVYYSIKKATSSKSKRKDLNGSLVTIKNIFGSFFLEPQGSNCDKRM